jgi:hypothetical protein
VTVVNIARCPVHGLHGCRDVCFAFEHEGRGDCNGLVEQVPMVPLDYLTAAELDWLESAARRAAGDGIAESTKATDALLELAGKLRLLRRGG